MKATSDLLEEIADMLGIDYIDDDEKAKMLKKLGHYVAAAEAYLASSGITVDYDTDPRILDAVTMYAGRRYDDPAQIASYADNAGMSLNALIEQIRLDQAIAKEEESKSADTSTDTSADGADTSTGGSSDSSDTTATDVTDTPSETTDSASKDGV